MDAQTKSQETSDTIEIYQVCDWEKHFEGAKTKTYNNKTTCSMPTKHGLGYKKLIRSENGVALFGAWCSLIQVLSRHEKTRQGYCTDTGKVHGKPYTAHDLEILTDIPKELYEKLFPIVQSVGWVQLREVKDTTRIPQEPMVSPRYPLNSDSNLNSNSNSDGSLLNFEKAFQMYGEKGSRQIAMRIWIELEEKDRSAIVTKIPAYVASTKDIKYRLKFENYIDPINRKWEDKIPEKKREYTRGF